jgi:diaminohydroxyphosphoribosylaminopyrimidine deaminase/5-amino-6-(5-phosphoribosylamino)uracil reductase
MSASEQQAADAAAMRRALDLAVLGPARGVNPRVGCVILSPAGERLAEGWHRGVGTAHAEVDALAKLEPGAARGATAVVTLEPCNHTGHTGPCALALIEAGIGRVVYAVADPGEHSSGGAERLRAAGVEVGVVLELHGQIRLVDVLDPDGNRIQLAQDVDGEDEPAA